MRIYCCNCKEDVEARLTDGKEIYPHRPDLSHIKAWKCDRCGASVGCHKNSKSNRPLGCIPSDEVKRARRLLHDQLIDPLWKHGPHRRSSIYKHISKQTGKEYHTGEIRTLEEARNIWKIVKKYERETT